MLRPLPYSILGLGAGERFVSLKLLWIINVTFSKEFTGILRIFSSVLSIITDMTSIPVLSDRLSQFNYL